MASVMAGEATPAQLGALLAALHIRGETVDEIAGCASALREVAVRVTVPVDAIDIVGTGGDRSNSFNISTVSAIVTAAAGGPGAARDRHPYRVQRARTAREPCRCPPAPPRRSLGRAW